MELVIDSTYKPLSFQELILPFVEYKKDYEKIEEDYSNLVALTEAWRNIANREKSPEAFEMFSRYANLLNAIADDFSQGMNPRNRSQLLAMKRGYASNILPIAQAAEAMKQANALRDEKGPDAIFEEGRYDSIDRFLNGQVANNKYESRKDISARTAALTLAAAQSILHDPEIKLALGEYGNQFLEVIQKTGLGGLAELESVIRGDAAAQNAFAKIKLHMLTEIGGLDRFDSVGRQAIELAINEGLYAGLHNYSTSLLANGEYMTKAQRLSNALGWAKFNWDKLQLEDIKERNRVQQDISTGRLPISINADGTLVYLTAAGKTWDATLKRDDRGSYEYKDAKGRVIYSELPGLSSYRDDKGELIPITPVIATYGKIRDVSAGLGGSGPSREDPRLTKGGAYGEEYELPPTLTIDTKPKDVPIITFDAFYDDLSEGIDMHDKDTFGEVIRTNAKKEVYDLGQYLEAEGLKPGNEVYDEIYTELENNGLKIADVLLMKDYDAFSDSHYLLVPKGFDIYGNFVGLLRSLITHKRGTKGSDNKKIEVAATNE